MADPNFGQLAQQRTNGRTDDMKLETGKEARREKGILLALAGSLALLGGCLDKGATDPELDENAAVPTATNSPPTISGTPTASIIMGSSYSFVPTAIDPDGDTLTFSIQNKPDWATFSTANGSVTGNVQLGDIGMYQNIAITVSDGERSAQLAPFSVQVMQQDEAVANNPPTISGTPTASILMGNSYSFAPTASDPDGDTLSFSIQNKPSWANFNTINGSITGQVQLADVGIYQNIAIAVSDGARSAQLAPFSVEVVQQGDGTVTLSWTPPTENTDGTPLLDLASYKIYYGLAAGNYPNEIVISNPGVATFVVEGLVPNTYFFVATAVNAQGVESDFSNVTTKVVL